MFHDRYILECYTEEWGQSKLLPYHKGARRRAILCDDVVAVSLRLERIVVERDEVTISKDGTGSCNVHQG